MAKKKRSLADRLLGRNRNTDARTDRMIKAGAKAKGPYGNTAGARSYMRIAQQELAAQSRSAKRRRK